MGTDTGSAFPTNGNPIQQSQAQHCVNLALFQNSQQQLRKIQTLGIYPTPTEREKIGRQGQAAISIIMVPGGGDVAHPRGSVRNHQLLTGQPMYWSLGQQPQHLLKEYSLLGLIL